MNLSYLFYNLVGTGLGLLLLPPLWLLFRRKHDDLERFYQRLGRYPRALRRSAGTTPTVWLHAVSVGEVGVAATVAQALRQLHPVCRIVLSCTTKQGLARARTQFGESADCIYAPVDLAGPVKNALKSIRPDVLALLETEIWPNWIVQARRMGARVAITNGRISVRTIHSYRKIKPLLAFTLSHVDAFSMISPADARRIESLGANRHRIQVGGNAKFDSQDPLVEGNGARQWAASLFRVSDSSPVIVAGSTRHAEEKILLEAYVEIVRHCPRTLLIIAPRHTQRIPQIEEWVREFGFTCQRRSELEACDDGRTAQVLLLDTIGELAATYSIASLVFCGGSLVPKGGQNVLEPAMWAKPVMFGPSMEDFADARALIEKGGGGVTVHHAGQLADLAVDWLRHPDKAQAAGEAARRAIFSHRGAASRHASVIARLL